MQNQGSNYLKVFLHGECNFQCISCQDSAAKSDLKNKQLLSLEETAVEENAFVTHMKLMTGTGHLARRTVGDNFHCSDVSIEPQLKKWLTFHKGDQTDEGGPT